MRGVHISRPDKLTIELYDDRAVVVESRDGTSNRKTVSTDGLAAAMVETMKMATGILPFGTRCFSGGKSEYTIGIEVPGSVRTLSFSISGAGKFSKAVPVPSTMFFFHVKGGDIATTRLFACAPPVLSENARLYWFPLGNVYENGNICWGSVKTGSFNITTPVVLDSVINRFFSSVFSGHLVHGTGAFRPPVGVVNLQTLIDWLEGKEMFPAKILKPANKVVKDGFMGE